MACDLVRVQDKSNWMTILEECGEYDTYHLPEYHELAESMGEGDAFLFVFTYGSHRAAFPFLLNDIDKLEGFEICRCTDATSVYGYPGVVTTVRREDSIAGEFRRRFQRELLSCLRELEVVTLFSRMNPLLDTSWLFRGIGDVQNLSETVSIDLTRPEDRILADMRENHRYRIRRALRRGITVEDDTEFDHLSRFMSMYYETMERHNADGAYFFPRQYFKQLRKTMSGSIKLLNAYVNGTMVSSFLFFTTGDIVQYHLSGTSSEYLRYDGPRVVLYKAALWARQAGFRWLHLGGGVGAAQDSLFHFKAGFSPVRHRFKLVRMIVNQNIYNDLVFHCTAALKQCGLLTQMESFFPCYRHPVVQRSLAGYHVETQRVGDEVS